MSGRYLPNRSIAFRILLLACILPAFAVLLSRPPPVHASEGSADSAPAQSGPQVAGIVLQDVDADGRVYQAQIHGKFVTGDDLLTVYDARGDLRTSDDWQAVIHFDHATLVFDAGADGRSELIVSFQRNGENYVALLFDDRNGDGQVSYRAAGKTVEITEANESGKTPAYPTLRVEAAGPWLLPDGRSQGNVKFSIDGFVPAQIAGYYPPVLDPYLANDGKVDFELEVVDTNNDGDPEYDLLRMMQPLPTYFEVFRTVIHRREGSGITRAPEGYLFWPFLGHAAWYEGANYLDSPPTIDMDWESAHLIRAGLWGYPTEAGWHMLSFLPLVKDQANDTNFETPMAYYDLAQNGDERPELHVRVQYQVPYGAEVFNTSYGDANEEIRYSWKHETGNNLSWDYKLGLFGRHTFTTEMAFPDFKIRMVPYAELPGWVVQNEWDMGIFVAREGRQFQSSEGIYSGAPFWPAHRPYLLGKTVDPPTITQDFIEPGMRGEYTWDLHSRPTLYMSSIDRKLHLKGAEKGFWKIYRTNLVVEYENLVGKYIDRWSLRENGVETKILYANDRYLVYADVAAQTLRMRKVSVAPTVFETLPPSNPDEWRDLDQKLRDHRRDLPPGDLAALLTQFEGEEEHVTGAMLRDYRRTPNGFRFVLTLAPGFRATGPGWLGLSALAPGDYAVTYDGSLSVEPWQPAILRIRLPVGDILENAPAAFTASQLRVIIANEGLQDARTVVAQASFGPPGREILVSRPQTVTVPAQGVAPLSFPWAPYVPGEWQVRVEARLLDEGSQSSDPVALEQTVVVLPAEGTPLEQQLSAFGAVAAWQPVLMLALLAAAGATLAWVFAQPASERDATGSSAAGSTEGSRE